MVKKKKKTTAKRKKRVVKKVIKRKTPKKTTKRKATRAKSKKPAKKPAKPKIQGKVIGIVTHYFPQVRAAVVKMKAPLSIGDVVKIKGHTTDFTQNVDSMEIDRVPITVAKKGQEIGLLVDSRVRGNDVVYKV